MKLSEMFDNLDELRIDNKDGWGAVPYNQNVDYRGLRVMVKPSMFLKLAHKLETPFSAGDIEQHIRADGAIGAPFLMVAIPQDWFEGDMTMPAEIYGHEGRNRMTAALRVEGDEPVETHLFFGGGLRNRDLKPEIVSNLNRNVISQEGTIVNGPWFSNGKNLNEMIRYRSKDLLNDVEQDFIKSYLLKAIETVEYYGARVDKMPKLKLLFDKNMHLIADYILRELHDTVADVTFIRDMRTRLNLIGMKLPDAKLTTYLRRYKIPIDARLHDMLAYDPIEAILFQTELAHWGLMVKDVISNLDKDATIKSMLQMMKNDRTTHVSQVIEILKRNGYDWPEFKAFDKSISTMMLKENEDQPESDRARLKKLFQDVEAAFLREDPYLVLEIMEETKAKMTDSPALVKMFNSNMNQITRIILDEFGADSDPWMMEMNINNLRNIGVPVPNPRMTKEIQRSRGWVTKEVKEIYEDDSILKAMDLIMVLSMLGMDISIRDVVGDLDQNKEKIIKDLLRAMKRGHTHAAGSMIRALRASGRDWPEFKAFDKSIAAATKLNEDDDAHSAEDIAKVVKAIAKSFNEGLPYDAIETLHYENLRIDDDPTIKALFDANMGRIAKWIANELATIDIRDIHDVMMSLESQIDDIGITIPNVAISDALQDAYTRIERNVIKQAMDSPTDAVIAIQALNIWGLGMELDDVIDVEDSKDEIIRSMLVSIKKNRPSNAFNMLSMLRDIDVDWPELDAIEKSLRSGTVVKEADGDSEKEQLRRVKNDWKAIKDIPNPSEKVQLISVRNDTRSLKFIKNPCDKARKIALMWDPKAITYLSNPTEADQLEAVKHFSRAIGHMKNPSEKVQIAAVRRSEIAIASIPNPSEKVQIAAVRKNGLAMFYIKNPSPALWKDEGAKKGGMVYMLSNIKEDPENVDGVLDNIALLKKLGCPWPELDVIAKSMEAANNASKWQLDEARKPILAYIKKLLPSWPDYVIRDWVYRPYSKALDDRRDSRDDWALMKQSILDMIQSEGLSTNTKWILVPNMRFTMDMWTDWTKDKLEKRKGGKSHPDIGVTNDAERHATQASLAVQQGGVRKEPVIVKKVSNQYELIEGWHRTIQHFKQFPEGYTGPAWVAVASAQESKP